MPTATMEQRLSDVESDVLQLIHRQRDNQASVEHLTNAVGDLSGQIREVRFDLGQLTEKVDRIESVQAEHGEMLRLILDRLPAPGDAS